MTRWHVSRRGKVRGPFSEPEVFELIGKRKVERGDLVAANESGNWWPIESVPTFAASFAAQPAPLFYPAPVASAHVPDSVCLRCGAQGRKVTRSRLTGSGGLGFVVFLVLCFPIALVMLLVGREKYTVCLGCGSQG